MKKIWILSLAWLTILCFSHSIMPAPAMAFTIGDEREVGEKLLYSVRSSFKLIDDPDITQYISKIGEDVLTVAGVQYFNYHFFVIADNDFNAFAAPSGLIFFHSGLVATMNSEDELLSVMAHEIGHIVKRHLASRVEKGKVTSIASLGLAVAAVAFGGAAAPALLTGALAAGQSVNLHFSRKHEEEADLLAYAWMKELQRNPEGQAKMLESMRRIARYRSDQLPQYLTTHPNPEARLEYIESLIDIDRSLIDKYSENTDDFEFLRFKYRILAKVKEPQLLRPYFANTMVSQRSTLLMKTMAEYGLSQVAMNENDYVTSLAFLNKVIDRFPEKSILQVDKGVIQYGAGDLIGAENTLRGALHINSSDLYATFYMGKTLYKLGRLDEAREFFTTVSYSQPEYSKVYFELGQIAADQQKYGESSFFLGKYNLFEGRIKRAVSSLKKSVGSKQLPEKMLVEAKSLLGKIDKMKK